MNTKSILNCCLLALCFCACTGQHLPGENRNVAIADSLLTNILTKYNVEKYGLLSETYPVNPENQVTYLAEGSEQKKNQEVSFLWPYSGMLSGCISLYDVTGDKKYLEILENVLSRDWICIGIIHVPRTVIKAIRDSMVKAIAFTMIMTGWPSTSAICMPSPKTNNIS